MYRTVTQGPLLACLWFVSRLMFAFCSFRAVGYVHAYDRLWQIFLRYASGTLLNLNFIIIFFRIIFVKIFSLLLCFQFCTNASIVIIFLVISLFFIVMQYLSLSLCLIATGAITSTTVISPINSYGSLFRVLRPRTERH